jgi:hypothetical protein
MFVVPQVGRRETHFRLAIRRHRSPGELKRQQQSKENNQRTHYEIDYSRRSILPAAMRLKRNMPLMRARLCPVVQRRVKRLALRWTTG